MNKQKINFRFRMEFITSGDHNFTQTCYDLIQTQTIMI